MGLASLALGALLLGVMEDRTGLEAAQASASQPVQGMTLEPTPTPTPTATPQPVRQVLGEEQQQVLLRFLGEQTGQWSVYLRDLETDALFLYGEENAYYPASLLKAPFVYWLCLRADKGEIDLDNTMIRNNWKGTLQDTPWAEYDQAGEIPATAVVWLAVAHSDNTATDRLNRVWSTQTGSFREFLTDLGFSNPESCITQESGIQGTMTVEDAGKIMEALYQYFKTKAPHAAMLKEAFLASDHEILYTPAGVEVAKKYGSWDYAYHDMTIVYGEHPYVLCVLTDQGNSAVDFPTQPTRSMGVLGQMVWDLLEGPLA